MTNPSSKPRIRIEFPHDIQAQPGYTETVDPKAQQLTRVITHYHLRQEFPCGIKTCRQPHKDGFLVALENGQCTNVGHVCGKQYWDKFEEMTRRYADAEVRPRLMSALTDFRRRAPELAPELERLERPAELIWQRRTEFSKQLPRLAVELKRRSFSNDARVTDSVHRSEQEMEDLEALMGEQYARRNPLKQVEVGVFTGLGVFKSSVRETVLGRLLTPFREIQGLDIASMPTKGLLEWDNWVANFDELRREAEAAIRDGEAFFTEANLRLCQHLALPAQEKSLLRTLRLEDLDKGRTVAADGKLRASSAGLGQKTETSPAISRAMRLLMRNMGRAPADTDPQ